MRPGGQTCHEGKLSPSEREQSSSGPVRCGAVKGFSARHTRSIGDWEEGKHKPRGPWGLGPSGQREEQVWERPGGGDTDRYSGECVTRAPGEVGPGDRSGRGGEVTQRLVGP